MRFLFSLSIFFIAVAGCLHCFSAEKRGTAKYKNRLECAVEPEEEDARIRYAKIYLKNKKHWKPEEFRVESKSFSDDKRTAILWGIFLEDEKTKNLAGGRSVILQMNCAKLEVVKELQFQ